MIPVISDPESLTAVSAGSNTESDSRDVLADSRRRAVLRYLDAREGPVSLSDLADHLVLEGRTEDRSALSGYGDALLGARRRIRISLRHGHVPKLADADAVAFDHETNTVSLGERSAEFLERVAAIDDAR
ncbi:DUF7344 domain-containing protein [Natronorubrum halophilum]|uniref:DUF7344 domain-containing protein n=1 Tax=Natronorubrum halophilum TaxID=1702106 RepID=UPI000EF6644E|nr:ArsR family transcriptional regulator [Natronorubrum halophilum]